MMSLAWRPVTIADGQTVRPEYQKGTFRPWASVFACELRYGDGWVQCGGVQSQVQDNAMCDAATPRYWSLSCLALSHQAVRNKAVLPSIHRAARLSLHHCHL